MIIKYIFSRKENNKISEKYTFLLILRNCNKKKIIAINRIFISHISYHDDHVLYLSVAVTGTTSHPPMNFINACSVSSARDQFT